MSNATSATNLIPREPVATSEAGLSPVGVTKADVHFTPALTRVSKAIVLQRFRQEVCDEGRVSHADAYNSISSVPSAIKTKAATMAISRRES